MSVLRVHECFEIVFNGVSWLVLIALEELVFFKCTPHPLPSPVLSLFLIKSPGEGIINHFTIITHSRNRNPITNATEHFV